MVFPDRRPTKPSFAGCSRPESLLPQSACLRVRGQILPAPRTGRNHSSVPSLDGPLTQARACNPRSRTQTWLRAFVMISPAPRFMWLVHGNSRGYEADRRVGVRHRVEIGANPNHGLRTEAPPVSPSQCRDSEKRRAVGWNTGLHVRSRLLVGAACTLIPPWESQIFGSPSSPASQPICATHSTRARRVVRVAHEGAKHVASRRAPTTHGGTGRRDRQSAAGCAYLPANLRHRQMRMAADHSAGPVIPNREGSSTSHLRSHRTDRWLVGRIGKAGSAELARGTRGALLPQSLISMQRPSRVGDKVWGV